LNRGDHAVETERSVENTDAFVAAHRVAGTDTYGVTGNASFPPNYVRQDDGRPRH
jgi:hypothetical protein